MNVDHIDIDLTQQQLTLWQGGLVRMQFLISSGKTGIGEIEGSGCTPRGWHRVRAKIGAGLPENAVLVRRRWTGEVFSPTLYQQAPHRDWILTRILWLCGEEVGKNRLGCVDTFRRYIYLHGTPDRTELGTVGSKGCIRVRNSDMIALFDAIAVGCKVHLHT
jgi:hypothetical protein